MFQKEEIEPLQVKHQDVNWLGQGLIQSAAKGASTEALEHDLDDAGARWKTLNKKVVWLSLPRRPWGLVASVCWEPPVLSGSPASPPCLLLGRPVTRDPSQRPQGSGCRHRQRAG